MMKNTQDPAKKLQILPKAAKKLQVLFENFKLLNSKKTFEKKNKGQYYPKKY